MEPWHIELFGSLRVHRGEAVLTSFARRRAGDVLACLARSSVPVSTSVLRARFWPESEARNPLTNLANCVHCLRAALQDPTLIITGQNHLCLAPGAFTTDVQQYEAELHTARQSTNPADRMAALFRAVAIPTGAFLENHYDPDGSEYWIEGERTGNLRAASEIALRALMFAPDSPTAQEAVLRLPHASGKDEFARTAREKQPDEAYTKPEEETRAALLRARILLWQGRGLTLSEETAFYHALRVRMETLTEAHRNALAALTVFPATFTGEQAQLVANVPPDTLRVLVDRLLVTPAKEGEPAVGETPRYALPEPARELAAPYLTPRQRKTLDKSHALHFAEHLRALYGEYLPQLPPWSDDAASAAQARTWLLANKTPQGLCPYFTFLFAVSPKILPEVSPQTFALAEQLLTDETLTAEQSLHLRCGIGQFATDEKQWTLAERVFQEATQMARKRGETALLINALACLPIVLHHAGRSAQAAQLMRELLEMLRAQDIQSTPQYLGQLHEYAEILLSLDDPTGALAAADEAIALRRTRGQRASLAPPLYMKGTALWRLERADEALAAWNEALRYFRETEDWHGMADCLQKMGWARAVQGLTEEGKQLVEQAIALYERDNSPHSRAACLGTLGDIWLRDDDVEAARHLYCEGLAFWQAENHAYWIPQFEKRLRALPDET